MTLRLVVLVLLAFVALEPSGRASADILGGDAAASTGPCGGIGPLGCCEGGTAYFCDDGQLRGMACGTNARLTACGLRAAFADCVLPGSSEAPRCSLPPAPPPGETALPDPGALAGTCPLLPATLALEARAADEACPAATASVAVVQTGCAFVATPLTGPAAPRAVGHADGRVVQLSYVQDGTPVTCLGAVAADDQSLALSCDGPWGFGASACGWHYAGAFAWPPPTSADGEDADAARGAEGGAGCGTGARGGWSGGLAGLLLVGALVRFCRRQRTAGVTTPFTQTSRGF